VEVGRSWRKDRGAVKFFFEFFKIFLGADFVFCRKLSMHQNWVAIFCNVNLSFGHSVLHAERERELESKSSNFYEARFDPIKILREGVGVG
jgi:hypothetical protein